MPVFTGTVSGQFGEPETPYETSVYSITDENGGDNNRLTWGEPASGSFSNYVQFDGTNFSSDINTIFPLGNLTYTNGTTSQNTSFQGDFPLTVSLSVSDPVNSTETFDFEFNILNTTNTTGDPVLDGDELRFSDAGISRETFNYNGTLYSLELFGFSSDGVTTIGQFNLPEEATTNGTLFGRITPASSTIFTNIEQVFVYREIIVSATIGYANGYVFQLPPSTGEPITISEETADEYSGGVLATDSDDTVVGSTSDDVIYGNQGSDSIEGGEGGDLIFSGIGNDLVYAGQDDDIINGNQDDDSLFGDKGNDLLRGGKGNDRVGGDEGDDILMGDLGSDSLTGGAGADTYIFRKDEATGQFDHTKADCILDFNAAEADRIGLTEDLSLQDLSFDSVDVNQDGTLDTIVKLGGTNEILGIVINVSSITIQSSIFTIATGDPVV